MDRRDALRSLDDIHRLVHHGSVFRGFRALPTALAAPLALMASLVQHWLLPDPAMTPRRWAILWVVTAIIAGAQALLAVMLHQRSASHSLSRTKAALEPFVTVVLTAAMVTVVIVARRPDAVMLLPGLWQIFYGLAILSGLRALPRAATLVAAAFLASGALLLGSSAEVTLSPLAMGGPFAAGHLLAAGILYWHLERRGASR